MSVAQFVINLLVLMLSMQGQLYNYTTEAKYKPNGSLSSEIDCYRENDSSMG